MRRSDREITDFQEMVAVMEKCDVCRLALNALDYPYIVPLNFGMQAEDGQVVLYFHGAVEGTKYELIARDNRASFEMDCEHGLVLDDEKGTCSMNYESVIGQGIIDRVPDEEKETALGIIMAHYRQEDFPFNAAVMPQTAVLKLTVSRMTGKRRARHPSERKILQES